MKMHGAYKKNQLAVSTMELIPYVGGFNLLITNFSKCLPLPSSFQYSENVVLKGSSRRVLFVSLSKEALK